MKRWLLSAGVLAAIVLSTSGASAAGVNLAWVNCYGEGTPVQDRTSGCATNSGTNMMVGSFVLDADLGNVSGTEMVIDLISQTDPLPPWWDMKNPTSCRPASLTVNFVANAANAVCLDWGAGSESGAIGAYTGTPPPGSWSIAPANEGQHRRIILAAAVPPTGLMNLTGGVEYFAFNLLVGNQKTVGTGNCSGCSLPVCIVLNSIKITTPVAANDVKIGNGTIPGSNVILWQGAGANCNAVPTKNRTWGQVKALYH